MTNSTKEEEELFADIDFDSLVDVVDETDPVADLEGPRRVSEGEARAADDRPARECIEELFAELPMRRRVMLGLLNYCRGPRFVADVNAEYDRLQEHDFSVYSAGSMCELLRQAGALELLSTGREQEPDLVEIDGVKYWQPRETDPLQWETTEEGAAFADADDPAGRLHAKLATEAGYEPIYLRILNLCAREGGATAKELHDAVDGDQLVQDPRRYAPYFFNVLEKDGALEWTGTHWTITGLGRDAREELAECADAE